MTVSINRIGKDENKDQTLNNKIICIKGAISPFGGPGITFFNKNLCILYLLTTFAPRYAKNDETYKAHEEAFHTMGRLSTALYNKIFKKAFPHRKAFLFGLCVMKTSKDFIVKHKQAINKP
jgi:hypothetical protein